MDVVSPLSLLEVSMSEEINANDDCIVIDDDDETPVSRGDFSKMEVEVDPLLVGSSMVSNGSKPNDMPTLWVSTNITNLAGVPHAETVFRRSQYSNVYEVLTETLHCTICNDHIGFDIRIHPSSIEHPILRVLICEHCVCMYKMINFMRNEKGKEINCRWCGKSSSVKGLVLRTCQQCPFSFCEVCIKNNCPEYFDCEPRFPWTCVVCNMRVLWPARATLWALHRLKSILLATPENSLTKMKGDISLCCKYRKNKKKKVVNALQSIGAVENFDLDQLVPPHLLNGSSDLYGTYLPDAIFPNNFESYHISQNPNLVKPRAKPRPKPKPKPRPKSKSSALTLNSPSTSVPNTVSSEINHKTLITTPLKPHWLRQKLIGYINDFDQLKAKLEEIEKSIDFDENDAQTEEKVDSVTTLLSLHRELLNSCRLSLINEWKEKKARLVLEKYDINNTNEVPEIKIETPSSKVMLEEVQRKKVSKSNNRKNSYGKVNFGNIEYENLQYPIKECFVKLKRLEIPLNIKEEKIKKEKNK